MRTIIFCATVSCIALLTALPIHAQSSAPLTVTTMVENQVCLSKDFVQVTLSAMATSDTQPVGFRWDFNNDGRIDTQHTTDPSGVHIYADESVVTSKVQAVNKAGQRAQDSISFSTLKCN
jgi:PKD repeat protein